MQENRIPKKVICMNLETRLRGRPRNRWQDEVREGEIVVGKGYITERDGRSA
jgi:primosomal replication protein N